MKLGIVSMVDEDGIGDTFTLALEKAREIYAARPQRKGFTGIDPEAMDMRNAAMAAIADMVPHLGTENFRAVNVYTFLDGAPIVPFKDWTLFVIANALERCNAGIASDNEPCPSMVRESATIKSLLPLLDLNHTSELNLKNVQDRPWSSLVQEQIDRRLREMGALGEWNAGILEEGRVLAVYPRYASPQALLTEQLHIWFQIELVDGTWVDSSEANAFRAQRALEIGTEEADLLAKIMRLANRRQAILESYKP